MPQPQPKAKPAPKLADLSADERAALVAELEAERRAQAEPWAPGAEPRELTARERATRLLLRDRDHVDGCPLIEDEHRSAGRVEAYSETRPANPARGEGPKVLTVVRCIECGGSRVTDGDVRSTLIQALRGDAAQGPDSDLDGSL